MDIGARFFEGEAQGRESTALDINWAAVYAANEAKNERYSAAMDDLGSLSGIDFKAIGQSDIATQYQKDLIGSTNRRKADIASNLLINKNINQFKADSLAYKTDVEKITKGVGIGAVLGKNYTTQTTHDAAEQERLTATYKAGETAPSAIEMARKKEESLLNYEDQLEDVKQLAASSGNAEDLSQVEYNPIKAVRGVDMVAGAQSATSNMKQNGYETSMKSIGALYESSRVKYYDHDLAMDLGMNYTYANQDANALIKEQVKDVIWLDDKEGTNQAAEIVARVPAAVYVELDAKRKKDGLAPLKDADKLDYALRHAVAFEAKGTNKGRTEEKRNVQNNLYQWNAKRAAIERKEQELRDRNRQLSKQVTNYSDGKKTIDKIKNEQGNWFFEKFYSAFGSAKKGQFGTVKGDVKNYDINNPLPYAHMSTESKALLKEKRGIKNQADFDKMSNAKKALYQVVVGTDAANGKLANKVLVAWNKNPEMFEGKNVKEVFNTYQKLNSYTNQANYQMLNAADQAQASKTFSGYNIKTSTAGVGTTSTTTGTGALSHVLNPETGKLDAMPEGVDYNIIGLGGMVVSKNSKGEFKINLGALATDPDENTYDVTMPNVKFDNVAKTYSNATTFFASNGQSGKGYNMSGETYNLEELSESEEGMDAMYSDYISPTEFEGLPTFQSGTGEGNEEVVPVVQNFTQQHSDGSTTVETATHYYSKKSGERLKRYTTNTALDQNTTDNIQRSLEPFAKQFLNPTDDINRNKKGQGLSKVPNNIP